jgi:hypothetical protein
MSVDSDEVTLQDYYDRIDFRDHKRGYKTPPHVSDCIPLRREHLTILRGLNVMGCDWLSIRHILEHLSDYPLLNLTTQRREVSVNIYAISLKGTKTWLARMAVDALPLLN